MVQWKYHCFSSRDFHRSGIWRQCKSGPGNTIGQVVIIPPTVVVDGEEVPVKEIAKGAYQGQGIIYVEFPEGLEKIEDYAFAGNQLIGVDIPKSVGHVGNYAFAYNEANKERTVGYVHINESDYVGDISKLGDIAPNGVKLPKVGQANLLEHIFITSSSEFEIPEDYNPGMPAPLKLINNNGDYINTNTNLSFSYEVTGKVEKEEWELNGKLLPTKLTGKLPAGKNTLRVRVMQGNQVWSKWASVSFEVLAYKKFTINNPGSNLINKFEYSLGNDLLFNYTNTNKLNWQVEKSGTYRIDILGAGSSGKGARVSGQLELVKGDLINLKIHSSSNGGGASGGGSANSGSAGTVVKLNDEIVIAAGGAGGKGGSAGGSSVGYAYGGDGGDGGLIGSNGLNGQGRKSVYNGFQSGGAGGRGPSVGGQYHVSSYYQYHGKNGPTIYDGGGGGKDGFPAGGGGAGGSSFTHAVLVNPVISGGQNSGNGSVTMTLIKEK